MLEEIIHRLEELERRLANVVRMGRVVEVDAARGLVKLQAAGLTTDWLPWTTQAGEVNVFIPPSVGQQMMLVSPSGEPGQGWAVPAGFSNQFAQPHDQAGEKAELKGKISLKVYKLTVGDRPIHHIDAMNGIRIINGVDIMADVRAHLGV